MNPAEFKARVRQVLTDHEGRVPFMYLDCGGVVTVGVGHALFSSADAVRLPFVWRSLLHPVGAAAASPNVHAGEPVRPGSIEAEYSRTKVLKIQPRQSDLAAIELPGSVIDRLLDDDVHTVVGRLLLNGQVSNWFDLPDVAKIALIDVAFEVGSLEHFPRLREAVRTENWTVAANECVVEGAGADRNKFRQDSFRSLA